MFLYLSQGDFIIRSSANILSASPSNMVLSLCETLYKNWVKFAWVSASMIKTLEPSLLSAMALKIVRVVLPTPPFTLKKLTIFTFSSPYM